jgi:predicted transcriptional regulator
MNGATKTKIMYDAYLSDENVRDYLKFLLKEDLLSYDKMKGVYKATRKAANLLLFTQSPNERIATARLQDDDDIF